MNHTELLTACFLAVIVAIVATVYLIVPRRTRPGLWFAVTVERSFADSAQARTIERAYRWAVVASSLAALGVIGISAAADRIVFAPFAPLLQLLGCARGFLRARRQTLPHAVPAETAREAALAPRAVRLPGGPILQAGPFVLLGAVAVALAVRFERLPERIPTHWNAAGHPDAWGPRSVSTVFGPLVIGTLVCLLLWGIALGALRSRRIASSGASGEAEARFKRITAGAVLGAGYLVAIVFSAIEAVYLGAPDWIIPLTLPLTVVFLVVFVLVLARAGQGGARLAATPTVSGDKTPDPAWKWGVFYVNREDAALLVEKRFGFGYTLNFGNPWAWVLLAALVLWVGVTVWMR